MKFFEMLKDTAMDFVIVAWYFAFSAVAAVACLIVSIIVFSSDVFAAQRVPIDPAALLRQPPAAADINQRSVVTDSGDSTGGYSAGGYSQVPAAPTVALVEPAGDAGDERIFTLNCGQMQYHLTHGRERTRAPAPLDIELQRQLLGSAQYKASYGDQVPADNYAYYFVTFRLQDDAAGNPDPEQEPQVVGVQVYDGETRDIDYQSDQHFNASIIKIAKPFLKTSNRTCSIVAQNPARTYYYSGHVFGGVVSPPSSGSPRPVYVSVGGWIITKPGFPSASDDRVVDVDFWNNAAKTSPENLSPYSEFVAAAYGAQSVTTSFSGRTSCINGGGEWFPTYIQGYTSSEGYCISGYRVSTSGIMRGLYSYLSSSMPGTGGNYVYSPPEFADPWGEPQVANGAVVAEWTGDGATVYAGINSVTVNEAPRVNGMQYRAAN